MLLKDKHWTVLFLGVLLAITYGSSLNHFYLSDDFIWLAKAKNHSLVQPLIEGFKYSGFVRPIFYLYIQTNYSIFGTSSLGWNVFQLLLHFGNCWLLANLMGYYFKNYWMGLFVAASFALHFINVETVVWLSAASYTFATFFILLTLRLYVLFKETGKRIFYLASFLSTSFALLSNEQAVSLFLILIVFEFQFPAPITSRFRVLLPYFLIIALYVGFRLFALDFRLPGGVYHPHVGLNFIKNYLFLTVGSLTRLDFIELLDYWRTFQSTGSFIELISNLAEKPGYFIFLICAPLAYMIAFLNSQASRFFILWGVCSFLPTAIFAGSGERLLYLPLTGLAALTPIWVHNLLEKFGSKKLFFSLTIVWIGYLFVVQQITAKHWRYASEITRETVEVIGQTAQVAGRPITVCVHQAPDHYYGAWVFRMGFEQLGELFYPDGFVETKLQSERDCPADSNRLLFFGQFRNLQLTLKPAN